MQRATSDTVLRVDDLQRNQHSREHIAQMDFIESIWPSSIGEMDNNGNQKALTRGPTDT